MTKELLDFPQLEYSQTFRDAFKEEKEDIKRLELQETLALVAHKLEASGGQTSSLTGGGLDFKKLTGKKKNLYQFRITFDTRVTCSPSSGTLILCEYFRK